MKTRESFLMIITFSLVSVFWVKSKGQGITYPILNQQNSNEFFDKKVKGKSDILNGATFSFLTEQDVFYYDSEKNEDRNYTQGTVFAYNNNKLFSTWMYFPFRFYQNLDHKRIRTNKNSGISLFGTAFTPRIIDSISPIIGDRPFGFLLGTSFSHLYKIDGVNQYEIISYNLGLFGTNIGYRFQSFAHKNIIKGRPENPVGWNTQISKGGRLTMLGTYERIFVFNESSSTDIGFGLDGNLSIGGSLGYYNRIFTSIYMRFGFLNGKSGLYWSRFGKLLSTSSYKTVGKLNNKPENQLDSVSNLKKDSLSIEKICIDLNDKLRTGYVELFGFYNLNYTYMGRNSFLLGQLANDSDEYVLEKDWIINNLVEFEFGIGVGFVWAKKDGKPSFLNLIYKNTIRTPEFDSKIFKKRSHYFGALGIQFPL